MFHDILKRAICTNMLINMLDYYHDVDNTQLIHDIATTYEKKQGANCQSLGTDTPNVMREFRGEQSALQDVPGRRFNMGSIKIVLGYTRAERNGYCSTVAAITHSPMDNGGFIWQT